MIAPRLIKSASLVLAHHPDVSLLKPLHGAEAGLEENLLSLLQQNWPAPVQYIFGLQNPADPAVAIVENLIACHPDKDIMLVVDPRIHGSNRKISNLIHIAEHARHDVLVLSDSDIRVPPHWLTSVCAALARPGIGAVTCLYTGHPYGDQPSLPARLASMGITYHFLPNVLMGSIAGFESPCFGSTIALTRQTLSAVGGFERFNNILADDYELGRAVRALGLTIAIPPLVVEHVCSESTATELLRHELRWNRTIRSINLPGHLGSILTHAVPLALLALLLLGGAWPALGLLLACLTGRFYLKYRLDRLTGTPSGTYWLLPLRDMLSFGVFIASLFGQSIHWRGEKFEMQSRGAFSQTEVS